MSCKYCSGDGTLYRLEGSNSIVKASQATSVELKDFAGDNTSDTLDIVDSTSTIVNKVTDSVVRVIEDGTYRVVLNLQAIAGTTPKVSLITPHSSITRVPADDGNIIIDELVDLSAGDDIHLKYTTDTIAVDGDNSRFIITKLGE